MPVLLDFQASYLPVRTCAAIATQSGGLGVPSSNLGAPTNKIKDLAKNFRPKSSQDLPTGTVWEDCNTMKK